MTGLEDRTGSHLWCNDLEVDHLVVGSTRGVEAGKRLLHEEVEQAIHRDELLCGDFPQGGGRGREGRSAALTTHDKPVRDSEGDVDARQEMPISVRLGPSSISWRKGSGCRACKSA